MPLMSGLTHLLTWKTLVTSLCFSMELLSLVIVACLVAVIMHWLSAPCPPRLPPGPASSSWLGLSWGRKSMNHGEPLYLWLQRLAHLHGPVVTVRTGSRPVVVVGRQSVVEELSLQTEHFQPVSWLQWLSHSSQTHDDTHRHSDESYAYHDVSNFLSHCITPEALEECVTSTLDVIIAQIRGQHGASFDPEFLMTRLVFDVIYFLFFGRRLPLDKYQHFLRVHLQLNKAIDRAFSQQLADSGTVPQSASDEMCALHNELRNIISDEIARLQNRSDSRRTRGVVGDLLDSQSTDQQTNSQPSRESSAGHLMLTSTLLDVFREWLDTSRFALCWTLLYLGHLPHVHLQCQQEIDAQLEGHAPGVADEDLLSYIQAVLLEVLRLRPCRPLVAPLLTTSSATLGGYDVEAGTLTVINQYNLYHDAHAWPDPEHFLPARYLARNCHPVCLLPIRRVAVTATAGPGADDDLIKLQLLLMVSSLLHNFSISLPSSDMDHSIDTIASDQDTNAVAFGHRTDPLALNSNTRTPGHADLPNSINYGLFTTAHGTGSSALTHDMSTSVSNLKSCGPIPSQRLLRSYSNLFMKAVDQRALTTAEFGRSQPHDKRSLYNPRHGDNMPPHDAVLKQELYYEDLGLDDKLSPFFARADQKLLHDTPGHGYTLSPKEFSEQADVHENSSVSKLSCDVHLLTSGSQALPPSAAVPSLSQLTAPRGTLWLRPPPFKVVLEPKPRERRSHVADWRSVTVDYDQSVTSHFMGLSSYAQLDHDLSLQSASTDPPTPTGPSTSTASTGPIRPPALRHRLLTQPAPSWLSIGCDVADVSLSTDVSDKRGPVYDRHWDIVYKLRGENDVSCSHDVSSDEETVCSDKTDFEMCELTK